ncbi:MAG: DUF3341 domain-containing protein [Deltaproteobacteria bacterium]|nr:DUF3341 domain-containing protein [Deltaproteobacteria bacterium]
MGKGIIGLYEHADDTIKAAEKLKDAGYRATIFSPVPLVHEIERSRMGERPNYIKWFVLIGCLGGLSFGFLFTLITSAMYVLPRGGRPIFSMTPTLLLSYETTILFGVLWTMFGFLVIARLPVFFKKSYDPGVKVDSFGVLVEDLQTDKHKEIERIMHEFGPTEVRLIENEQP